LNIRTALPKTIGLGLDHISHSEHAVICSLWLIGRFCCFRNSKQFWRYACHLFWFTPTASVYMSIVCLSGVYYWTKNQCTYSRIFNS